MSKTHWEYTLYVPHDPRAVGICRRTLRDILTTHHLTDLLEPAELLASELVTNALRHTDGPAAMKIRQSGSAFRLGAWDTDPTPPTITTPTPTPTPTSTSGRGLHLVNAYADDWGWFAVNGTNGKYIWCELGTKPD